MSAETFPQRSRMNIPVRNWITNPIDLEPPLKPGEIMVLRSEIDHEGNGFVYVGFQTGPAGRAEG